jgi:hypothetical protein
MFLHEKMFGDTALCHDVNSNVPAIFIVSVLLTHDNTLFPVFEDWSEQYLKEHIILVEKLLQYIHHPKISSIYRKLWEIDRDMEEAEFEDIEFDFYCSPLTLSPSVDAFTRTQDHTLGHVHARARTHTHNHFQKHWHTTQTGS